MFGANSALTPNIELGLRLSPSGFRTFPPSEAERRMPALLVELTGIEPVASWLQTRRSPS